MKYTLYRSFGNLDNDVRKHELAAVEYAPDIYAATDALVRAVADDLAGMPEYAGCETTSFAQSEALQLCNDRSGDSTKRAGKYPH